MKNILRWAGVGRKLLKTVRKRLISFLGYVYRKDHVERAVLTGRVDDGNFEVLHQLQTHLDPSDAPC